MKIHKQLKIEAACSGDKLRASICEPYLDRSSGGDQLVATNGRIIAVVPVECDDSDTTGYVPKACLKDARKLGYVGLNGAATVGAVSYPRDTAEKYPSWRSVIPNNSGKKITKLRLDIGLLSDLAMAIGSPGLCLEIPENDEGEGCVLEPVIVRPASFARGNPAYEKAYGVIMPMRMPRNNDEK